MIEYGDINQSFFTGCLGNDPELKKTPDGKYVCNLRLAVTRPKAKGADEAEVDWFDIVAWNGTAEACAKYLCKGSKVAITATARTRTWKDQNGSKRNSIDFIADEVKFFTPKNQSTPSYTVTPKELEELATDEELPFN